ncbi:MAG: ribbon-helix-helix domain-containing protein [Nanoarchaeota archaeon]|nr:ribbon-helix-helix domain-containing protein [Nanoarchaeota archaeon]
MVKQINVKLPENLVEAANRYAQNYGFRNIQELIAESMREKIFEKNEFDENFSEQEINLIDDLITLSVKNKDLIDEEQLNKILLE